MATPSGDPKVYAPSGSKVEISAIDGTASSSYSSAGMKYGDANAINAARYASPSAVAANNSNTKETLGAGGGLIKSDFVGPLDGNARASLDVGKVTAPIDFDGHILRAEIKPNGSIVGGHSTATNEVRVIPGTASATNAQGVYTARIEVPDPARPGHFLPKTNGSPPGTSTMFPDAWTADRIKVEVDWAYAHRTPVHGSPGKWQGVTPSGVKVEGYLSPKVTVYPKL